MLFQKAERLVTDDLTPAEMRALLRSATHVLSDIAIFRKVHPKMVDQKVVLSAMKKLGEASRTRKGKGVERRG